jgi:hypothetical protein
LFLHAVISWRGEIGGGGRKRTGKEDDGACLWGADAVGDGLEVELRVGEGHVAAFFGEGGFFWVGILCGHGVWCKGGRKEGKKRWITLMAEGLRGSK